jgi:hypothetical protein
MKRGKMEHWSNGVIQQWICGAEEQLYSRAVEQRTIDGCTDAKLLDEIQKKFLRVFLLVIHIHFYSFALRFIFLSN